MNSYEIIKQQLVTHPTIGSVGRLVQLNQAGELFVSLEYCLIDWEEARKTFNADKEFLQAMLQRHNLQELKEAGVL